VRLTELPSGALMQGSAGAQLQMRSPRIVHCQELQL